MSFPYDNIFHFPLKFFTSCIWPIRLEWQEGPCCGPWFISATPWVCFLFCFVCFSIGAALLQSEAVQLCKTTWHHLPARGREPLWFTASRGKCDTLSQGFHSQGFPVQFWHAKMLSKASVQMLWEVPFLQTEDAKLLCLVIICYLKTLSFEGCCVHKSHSGWSFCRISSIWSWWRSFELQNIPPQFWWEFLFPQPLLSQADFSRQKLTLSDSILELSICGHTNFLIGTPKFILWKKPKK